MNPIKITYPNKWPEGLRKNVSPARSKVGSNWFTQYGRLYHMCKKYRFKNVELCTNTLFNDKGKIIKRAQTFHCGIIIKFDYYGKHIMVCSDMYNYAIANLNHALNTIDSRMNEKKHGVVVYSTLKTA